MFEPQEAPENTLFRASKSSHLGTAGRATEHGNQGYDEKLAKVVSRIFGARIGNVIVGGEEDVNGGSGPKRRIQHPESIPLSATRG